MTLFNRLVDEALQNQPSYLGLRAVVEKELLHRDILNLMSNEGYLDHLTFIGGTCLRACYGGSRLSEDLDFTGGADFSKEDLTFLGKTLSHTLEERYGLNVNVTDPKKEGGMVSTWKIKIETRPESTHLPAQRINIDVCALPSYDRRPQLIQNIYRINHGFESIIVQAQSLEEIYIDKIIAVALRENRLKYRDLWDIQWMHARGIQPTWSLLPLKLKDRSVSFKDFLSLFKQRVQLMSNDASLEVEFTKEMSRFLPVGSLPKGLWEFINNHMKAIALEILKRERL